MRLSHTQVSNIVGSTWVCGPEWSAASGGWCCGSSSVSWTAAASSWGTRAGSLSGRFSGSPPGSLLWVWAWVWWAWSTSGPVELPPLRTPRSSLRTARSWRSEPGEGLLWGGFTWASLKPVQKAESGSLHQTFWCHDSSGVLFCSYCLRSSPRVHMFEQIPGLSMVAPKASPPKTHWILSTSWSDPYLYWKPLSSVHVEIISAAARGEKKALKH